MELANSNLPVIVRLNGSGESAEQFVTDFAKRRIVRAFPQGEHLDGLLAKNPEDAKISIAAEQTAVNYRTDYATWKFGNQNIDYIRGNPAKKIADETGINEAKHKAIVQLTQHTDEGIRAKSWEILTLQLDGLRKQFDSIPEYIELFLKDAYLLATRKDTNDLVRMRIEAYVKSYETPPAAPKIGRRHYVTSRSFGAGR